MAKGKAFGKPHMYVLEDERKLSREQQTVWWYRIAETQELRRYVISTVLGFFLLLIPLRLVHAADYTNLIELFSKGDPKEKQEAKDKLLSEIQRMYNPAESGRVLEGTILFTNITGNQEKDCVVAVNSSGPSNTDVLVFRKEKDHYGVASHINVGIFNNITTVNLIDKDIYELVIDSEGRGTGWTLIERDIYKWDGRGRVMRQIWDGVLKDIFYGERPPDGISHDIKANIQYVDLDNDGIREIIRKGRRKQYPYNEEIEEWNDVMSESPFYQEYKWDPKNFKYQLKVSQGLDNYQKYQGGEKEKTGKIKNKNKNNKKLKSE